jgi:hypothetical protein
MASPHKSNTNSNTGTNAHTQAGVSEKYRVDGANSPGQMDGIGHAFAPMIHTAPIHGMQRRPSTVFVHVDCGSKIFHDGVSSGAECGGCGATITHKVQLASP